MFGQNFSRTYLTAFLPSMKQMPVANLLLSFASLMIFWLVMSGIFKPMQIGQGVVCAIVVIAVNYRMKRHMFFKDELVDLMDVRFFYVPVYVIWLWLEIVKSGLHVAWVIISPSRSVETSIVKFRVDLPHAHARMILGNSITLTPGTLTIDIVGDEFTVHALTDASFGSLADDIMPRKVLRLFSTEDRPVIRDFRVLRNVDQLQRP